MKTDHAWPWILTVCVAVLLGLASREVQREIAEDARRHIAHSLVTVRDTTHHSIRAWLKDHEAAARLGANRQVVADATRELLSLPPEGETLLGAPAQQILRDWHTPVLDVRHYEGYFIVSPDGINLASSRDGNVGISGHFLASDRFLSTIMAGGTAISPPMAARVLLPDLQGQMRAGMPTMFVGAPVVGDTGDVIAAFLYRLRPEEGFSSILSQGRIGRTGETYAFDRSGRLISHSRYDQQLRDAGLIPPDREAMLHLVLRDPGVNLIRGEQTDTPPASQPLTRMASAAVRGGTGVDVSGYRDYRGVPVVGAWLWDAELGIGITTEMDVKEAYRTLQDTTQAITALTTLIILLAFVLTVVLVVYRQRRRAESALREREMQLSSLVEDLRQAATVFDNTNEGIVVCDADRKIIAVNAAFTRITGYSREEVLGQSPQLNHSGRHDEAFYQAIWHALETQGEWRGEVWSRRKNGEIYPTWENITVIKDKHGHAVKYVALFSDITTIKQAEERMTHIAHHDPLTGLPNRLRFTANLEQALAAAKRHKQRVALMYLDLDGFKPINDTMGHIWGDKLLQVLAGRIKNGIRGEETAARIGGDEFTIILSEISRAEDAIHIAQEVIDKIREPVRLDGKDVSMSVSIGISVYPDDADAVDDLIGLADEAMYTAKRQGPGRFQLCGSSATSAA